MNGLRDRLNRIKNEGSQPTTKRAASKEKREETEINPQWGLIGVALQQTEYGTFLIRKQVTELDHKHGHYVLADILEFGPVLAAIGGETADGSELDPTKLLFFDTETTGLGIGAGNVAFMLGIGYLRDDCFVTEQMFIRNPGEEAAMLAYLAELLPDYTHLVSYNGRTFDWPLLKNRFIINRMEISEHALVQLDFLYTSRSLWRHTLPSCRLGQVEESRLGFFRHDDVPGSLAPMLYFQFLSDEDPAILKGVFVHNEHDLMSLAGLAIHFGRALNGALNLMNLGEEELLRLGMWLDKRMKPDLAEEAFDVLMARKGQVSSESYCALATIYKGKGQGDLAAVLWQAAIDSNRGRTMPALLEPFIKLSMYYEHQKKDYTVALEYAEQAWQIVRSRAALSRRQVKNNDEMTNLQRRVERLQSKRMRNDMNTSLTSRNKKDIPRMKKRPVDESVVIAELSLF